MKPLNLDNRPCSPISSNCVVWQGPTLDCINLCAGDTVSDVVANLATELCTLLDQTNVTNYDLTCLGITACGPKDFQALIQLLIDKICELQNINPAQTTTSASGSSVDVIVSVAPCLQTGNVVTMQLLDYVQLIAERLCAAISEINNLKIQVESLNNRVLALESKPKDSYTLPSFVIDCTLTDGVVVSGTAYTIDTILQALLNDDIHGYCALIGSTGLPAALLAAVASQCVTSSSDTLTEPGTPFGTKYLGTWVNTPGTVADTINNLWIVLCDVYTAFKDYVPPTSDIVAGDGISVASSTVGTVTTYTVSSVEKPGLSVTTTPTSLLKTLPSLSSTLCVGTIQVMASVEYNDFGAAYDPTTGIFTVPEEGVYSIGFFVNFTKETDEGWYDLATPGMFIAGITSPIDCNFYCVNNDSPVVSQKHASISGSLTGKFSVGTQLCLKVLNLTAFDYSPVAKDIVRLYVERVR